VRKLPEGAQVGAIGGERQPVNAIFGRSNFKLGCLPIDDFPKMPEGDLKHNFTLSASDLRALVDRTRFAISTEEYTV